MGLASLSIYKTLVPSPIKCTWHPTSQEWALFLYISYLPIGPVLKHPFLCPPAIFLFREGKLRKDVLSSFYGPKLIRFHCFFLICCQKASAEKKILHCLKQWRGQIISLLMTPERPICWKSPALARDTTAMRLGPDDLKLVGFKQTLPLSPPR